MWRIKFFKNIFLSKPSGQPGGVTGGGGIDQRLQQIVGQDKMEQQLLYERWVARDTWLLRREALPLLQGLDPESFAQHAGPDAVKTMDDLWKHARACVSQGLLKVDHQEKDEEEWRCSPVNVYHWAVVSRLPLPEAFSILMGFVTKVIKPAGAAGIPANQDGINTASTGVDENREKVLGMALAILAAYPELSRNSRGQVHADQIIQMIEDKGKFWLGDQPLRMSTTDMRDLINRWLDTLPPQLG